ncbi:unnamed protein product, partial [Prorocentrum cordatum]
MAARRAAGAPLALAAALCLAAACRWLVRRAPASFVAPRGLRTVLDEWEAASIPAQILENLQDPELEGQSVMKFRDVYRLLEIMGMDRETFVEGVAAATEVRAAAAVVTEAVVVVVAVGAVTEVRAAVAVATEAEAVVAVATEAAAVAVVTGVVAAGAEAAEAAGAQPRE